MQTVLSLAPSVFSPSTDARDVATDGTARLDVIRAEDVVDWLAVEYDWEDLCERHGVLVMPTAVPRTEEELRETRFFVIAFVCKEGMVGDEVEEEEERDEGMEEEEEDVE